jgi:hypothetical protein
MKQYDLSKRKLNKPKVTTERPLKRSVVVNTSLKEEQSYQALVIKQQPLHLEPKPGRQTGRNDSAGETRHFSANLAMPSSQ